MRENMRWRRGIVIAKESDFLRVLAVTAACLVRDRSGRIGAATQGFKLFGKLRCEFPEARLSQSVLQGAQHLRKLRHRERGKRAALSQ